VVDYLDARLVVHQRICFVAQAGFDCFENPILGLETGLVVQGARLARNVQDYEAPGAEGQSWRLVVLGVPQFFHKTLPGLPL